VTAKATPARNPHIALKSWELLLSNPVGDLRD
jgi:hypothetical protein